MAINVDTVYQKVLAILNKEQRGFLPPDYFDLYADQAQLDIFEQYFYDQFQYEKIEGSQSDYVDMLRTIEEKISLFETTGTLSYSTDHHTLPANLYKFGTLLVNGIQAEKWSAKDYLTLSQMDLIKPSAAYPIYIKYIEGVRAYDAAVCDGTDVITLQYVKKPSAPHWGYTMVGDAPLYSAGASTNFEIHPSDEDDLILKILALAGVEVRDLSVYQVADKEEIQGINQEKGK